MGEDDYSGTDESGFLGRQHHRLRFTELSETFFGRLILSKCPNVSSRDLTQVQISLADFYRQIDPTALEKCLKNVTFEISNKMTELVTDGLNAICGTSFVPHANKLPAIEYFTRHIKTRLQWLQTGEPARGKLACIESYTHSDQTQLPTFVITVRPSVLAEQFALAVQIDLELAAELLRMLLLNGQVAGELPLRIDYRKQVESLIESLDTRQRITGEKEFCILSNQMPFRWALLSTSQGFTMPSPATTTSEDKVLLPLLLEINGLLDIHTLDLDSDPTDPNNVVVRYYVSRPAVKNLFAATGQGLIQSQRSRLNETELWVYDRIHHKLCVNLMFGGRPKLEISFGSLCSWLIHKAAYCLEEAKFLRDPAREWLTQHAKDSILHIENDFFLPHIYERLREEFGSKVVKKPERFAGEIDILFDDHIPIELKVRRGKAAPLFANELQENYRPGSQAAAYAAVSRLGFVVLLDLPEGEHGIFNLEHCADVIVKEVSANAGFPTCIVVVVFHCHHPRPSSVK